MNIIRKLIYKRQSKKYGDPRYIMLWINGNNRFFLKDGYTIDQLNETSKARDRKAMIDFSPKRWKEWICLQRRIQRRKTLWRAWWNATHKGAFKNILSKLLREPYQQERKLLMFQQVMSKGEFERFTHSPPRGKTP